MAEDRISEDGHLHPATVKLPGEKTDVNDPPHELIKAVDGLLDNLSTKFSKISTEVFAKSGSLAVQLKSYKVDD
ncbi:MAG: hypothetical protein LQ343_008007 [Gyalolechia ehrenbergii]|nr:MAG: hypothetical protein LQ343_008007 [Gyalolechia ehrenbergii]